MRLRSNQVLCEPGSHRRFPRPSRGPPRRWQAEGGGADSPPSAGPGADVAGGGGARGPGHPDVRAAAGAQPRPVCSRRGERGELAGRGQAKGPLQPPQHPSLDWGAQPGTQSAELAWGDDGRGRPQGGRPAGQGERDRCWDVGDGGSSPSSAISCLRGPVPHLPELLSHLHKGETQPGLRASGPAAAPL